MVELKRWVVTTSGSHPFAQVRESLQQAGFEADQALETIGLVTGCADEALAARLRNLPGVADVSPETGADIGPPGSEHTW
jgi:hypothetical protein